jgi:type I restriction enzyme S subunit
VARFGDLTINHDGRRVPVKASDRSQRRGPYPYYGASGIIDRVDDYLFDGDFLLVSEDGANLLARATPIAFRAHGRFWVNNHAHVVQSRTGILDSYLEIAVEALDLGKYVTGSAQPKLTQAALNGLTIPVPSTAEQEEISRRVQRVASFAQGAERRLDAIERGVDRGSASILERAFLGGLMMAVLASDVV